MTQATAAIVGNAPCRTALKTKQFDESVGMVICTTPAYSPENNGMASLSGLKGGNSTYARELQSRLRATKDRSPAIAFAIRGL